MNDRVFEWFIDVLLENAKEAQEGTDDYSIGKRTAYYEMLNSLKSQMQAYDMDVSKFGLDFDLEKLL